MSDQAVQSHIQRAKVAVQRYQQAYGALVRLKENSEMDIPTGEKDQEGNDILRKKIVVSPEVKSALDEEITKMKAVTFSQATEE